MVGKTIKAVRRMNKSELTEEGWEGQDRRLGTLCVVIELNDGTCLYASRDSEGNGPGVLFGRDGNGSFRVEAR